jgi:hypothetical protein
LEVINYMHINEAHERRVKDRRVDKIAGKTRIKFLSLKRTVGPEVARRYLTKNGHTVERIESMTLLRERRKAKRRSSLHPARFDLGTTVIPKVLFEKILNRNVVLLRRLECENETGVVILRICDCPARFIHSGFIVEGSEGEPRITKRGRESLLMWTRVCALVNISQAYGLTCYPGNVEEWLKTNRFVASSIDGRLVVTPRGVIWMEINLSTLTTHNKR